MPPQTQTLFSVTLFFALSSLLAWSNRRNRAAHTPARPIGVTLVRSEESVNTAK